MAYSKYHNDWKDDPDTTTPIDQAALEHIETGVVDADAAATAAAAAAAVANAKRLDQIVAPTGDVSLNSQKIIGLATPTVATDAANKAYVDAVAAGLDPKQSVRAVTTANITLSGAQTIDGVAVIATNRVLVKNQTTGSENGVYVAAAGAWARSTDADADVEVTAGLYTFAEEGTVGGNTGWVLITDNPITVGTTALTFTQFTGTGGAPTGTAGGVLGGTYPNPSFAADMATQVELDAHINDTTAAHAASAISFTPDGSIAASTVQLAIQEVRDEAGVGGGSVNDQTISTTDNATNNASIAKHGWTPKGNNNRSSYLDGTLSYRNLWSGHDWFVDEGALAGGDGHSPNGAFNTFAAADAAAAVASRDVIQVCSDLNGPITISSRNTTVAARGKRMIFAPASSSVATRIVSIISEEVTFEDFFIWGNPTFTGVCLMLDQYSDLTKLHNINIDGTGGSWTSTFYPTGEDYAGTPAGGTGIGGIGIGTHHSDHARGTDISITNCSIGIGLGVWSTRHIWDKVFMSQCAQFLVEGLNTGSWTGRASTSAWGYGNWAADAQTGGCTFNHFSTVNNMSTSSFAPAMIDLIGDQSTNCSIETTGGNKFHHCDWTEGSGGIIRIGSRGNKFELCSSGQFNTWLVYGQRNHFDTFTAQGLLYLQSNNNVVEDTIYQGGNVYGPGALTVYKNIHFPYASGNTYGAHARYENCEFDTGITYAHLGVNPVVVGGDATAEITYAPTMTPNIRFLSRFTIVATDTVPFTIVNPIDARSADNTIMRTSPITFDIKNSSSGTMGNITWGSNFLLDATGFIKPLNGKRKTITFYYDPVSTKWVQMGPTSADI